MTAKVAATAPVGATEGRQQGRRQKALAPVSGSEAAVLTPTRAIILNTLSRAGGGRATNGAASACLPNRDVAVAVSP